MSAYITLRPGSVLGSAWGLYEDTVGIGFQSCSAGIPSGGIEAVKCFSSMPRTDPQLVLQGEEASFASYTF